MNNKSKGTTLIEILISILLMSFIMIFLFNILITIKEEYNVSTERSQDSINRATYTRIIQNDLVKTGLKKINVLNEGNENKFCIEFEFNDSTKKKLTVENFEENNKRLGRIIYDDEGWTLSDGTYNISDIKFTYVEPKYDKYRDSGDTRYLADPNTNYHLLKIVVPVSTDILSNKKFDVEISHVDSNSIVDSSFCTDIKSYFQNVLGYSDIVNSNNINCINN